MELNEPKNRECYRCYKFVRYYTKGFSRYVPAGIGYCTHLGRIVESVGTCEEWHKSGKPYSSKKTSLRVLSEMLENITGIRQILEEAQDEEKE